MSMNAVYRGRAYYVGEEIGLGVQLQDVRTGEKINVPFSVGPEELIVDCTDAEFFSCENVPLAWRIDYHASILSQLARELRDMNEELGIGQRRKRR